MEPTTRMGMNRTGVQMSPLDAAQLAAAAARAVPDPDDDENDAVILRGEEVADADRIGSVPLPGTMRGAMTTGMAKMAGQKPEVLIDKLGERLAFERTGTRMYDALLVKCEAMQGTIPEVPLDALRRFRDEEARHFKLLEGCLQQLGADPTAQTPCADVVGVSTLGVLQVVSDPRTNLPQSLNAVLTAELTDNAGWELLIELARAAGRDEMADRFMVALQEEQQHLSTVRALLRQAVMSEAT